MLAFLRGTILAKTGDYLIVDVHDLGYRVFVTKSLLTESLAGQAIELFLYQHVREDASDLYGFKKQAELELFQLLISVSGVGPKSASAIIDLAPVEALQQAIAAGDDAMLTKVSGIGGKTAQRVILELRGKLAHIETSGPGRGEEIEALISLGYSSQQAREALQKVDSAITDSGERIKQALKHI